MNQLADNLIAVLVFKTNVETESEKQNLFSAFKKIEQIEEVSVDLEDIDKVLRVVSLELTADEIIEFVKRQGFNCEELE